MATYAIVRNGIVENTIVCGPQDIPSSLAEGVSWVEYTEENPAVIGLGYNGTTFEQMLPSVTAELLTRITEEQANA